MDGYDVEFWTLVKALVGTLNQEIKKPLPINRLQLYHLHKSAAADTSTEAGIQSLEIKCAISEYLKYF